MAPSYNLAKLEELCQLHQIPEFDVPQRLARLSQNDVPSYGASDHMQDVAALLTRYKGSVRKPFFKTKRSRESHEFQTITEILPHLLEQNADPGIVQPLLRKASNVVKDLSKRESQNVKRDSMLTTAATKGNVDVVWLLAPSSSQAQRNAALVAAVTLHHEAVVLKLLEYGADPNVCATEFKKASLECDLIRVSMLLRAPTPIKNETLIEALAQAVEGGSVQLVSILTKAADLRSARDIPALHKAVQGDRLDMLLTIARRAPSLHPPKIDPSVMTAYLLSSAASDRRLQLTEVLLYSGACGVQTQTAFARSVQSDKTPFIELFARHHVDINWDNGSAIVAAAQTGRRQLVETVLASGTLLPENASRAMQSLPTSLHHDERRLLNSMFLNAGAQGHAVDQELVLAVRNNDEASVTMLLQKGASLNHNNGQALIQAIQDEHMALLKAMLRHTTTSYPLKGVLPHVCRASKQPRLEMFGAFLLAGASGDAVDAALAHAVADPADRRDRRLIDALIEAGADPTHEDARSIRHTIREANVAVFKQLLRSPVPSLSAIVSVLVADIIIMHNRTARYYMMQCAIEGRANQVSVSDALIVELGVSSPETRMVALLLDPGKADVDRDGGRILKLAALQADESILDITVASSKISSQTMAAALREMLIRNGLAEEQKARRAKTLLSRTPVVPVATEGLSAYTDYCAKLFSHGRDWPLKPFLELLKPQRDLITHNGQLIDMIVKNGATSLMRAILEHQNLDQAVIDKGLLRSVALESSQDRANITHMLLDSRPSSDGVSSVLIKACRHGYADVLEVLLRDGTRLDMDNYAAVRVAASSIDPACLNVLLRFGRNSRDALSAAFVESTRLTDSEVRLGHLRAILEAGLRGDVIDQYLIHLVGLKNVPLEEIQLLLDYQASVHAQASRAPILAATSKKRDVLQLLFTRVQLSNTASRCFEACMAAGLIQQHEIRVLQFLLEKYVNQLPRDEALLIAANNLAATPPGGLPMVQLLVKHGANPDFAQGQALCHACEIGRFDSAMIILALRPSRSTRSRALHHLVKCNSPSSAFCSMADSLVGSSRNDDPTTRILEEPLPSFRAYQEDDNSAIRVLLSHRPGDTQALRKVLEYGCSVTTQPEQDLMFWCMSQTDFRVKKECLRVLIEAGANVKYKDPSTGDTVLLLALQTGRAALLDLLLSHGADPSAANERLTPLRLASEMGDDVAVRLLVDAGARVNDGSLHQAARSLHSAVVRFLLKHKANANYRSPAHGGRTPLAELYLNGDASGPSGTVTEDLITELCRYGANVQQSVERRPLILLAFANPTPVAMVTVIMSAYLSEHIDEPFNLCEEDGTVYSPVYYLSKVLARRPLPDWKSLVQVLKTYGSKKDVYYRLEGPQPADAVGMPPHIEEREAQRKAEEDRIRKEQEAHERQIRRMIDEEHRRAVIEQGKHEVALAQDREVAEHKLALTEQANAVSLSHQRRLNDESYRAEEGQRELRRSDRRDVERHHQSLHDLKTAAVRAIQNAETAGAKDRLALTRAAYQEQKRIEVESRKQIGNEERKMIDHRSKADEKKHQWTMDQLAMAKAIPIGVPQMIESSTANASAGNYCMITM
ncbi:hypothetical protein PV11_03870 [Exophiala sideris]|uniref:Uncharacterized protein n=1 Tax=Exophiala sideris TaxID=1016849 RepID=A0A0D1YFM6_9EURO|nr:hypothetical protein PV11_03870 [Exophiala sideris]